MTLKPFKYGDERESLGAVVRAAIPANIVRKQVLLETLAEQLSFPDYFGANWDALNDCLRDLSWLPPGLVVLIHTDVPLVNDIPNARIYLAILSGAVCKMSKSEDHPLSVVFPDEFREQIKWLLRSQPIQDAERLM